MVLPTLFLLFNAYDKIMVLNTCCRVLMVQSRLRDWFCKAIVRPYGLGQLNALKNFRYYLVKLLMSRQRF